MFSVAFLSLPRMSQQGKKHEYNYIYTSLSTKWNGNFNFLEKSQSLAALHGNAGVLLSLSLNTAGGVRRQI